MAVGTSHAILGGLSASILVSLAAWGSAARVSGNRESAVFLSLPIRAPKMGSNLPQLGSLTSRQLPCSWPYTGSKRTCKPTISPLPSLHLRCQPEFRARATGDSADQADKQVSDVVENQAVAISNPPEAGKNDAQTASTSPRLLAVAAVAVGVIAFGASRLGSGGVSLAQVASTSTPLDEALSNGRPTVVEFYANYCDVCRELAPTTYAVRSPGFT